MAKDQTDALVAKSWRSRYWTMKIIAVVLTCIIVLAAIALVFYMPVVGGTIFVTLAILVAFSKRSFREKTGSLLKDLLTGW